MILGRRRRGVVPDRFRAERFGGVFQTAWPRALVFVDRERARSLGREGGALWDGPAAPWLSTRLVAPLEAHLQLTSRCAAGCRSCYVDARPGGREDDRGPAFWRRALDGLARLGVFQVALGGGESADLPWLPEIVEHALSLGLVPNLTTGGLLSPAAAALLVDLAPRLGQINVSLDGTAEAYRGVRGHDGFRSADDLIVRLRRATRHVGVNVVLTRDSFARLDDLCAHVRRRGLREVEVLRLKPTGRGVDGYADRRLDALQRHALLPLLLHLARRHRLRLRLDCSFVPMLAWHRPPPSLLAFLGVQGCVGGDHLVSAQPDGRAAACSFAAGERWPITDLGARWDGPEAFASFRRWLELGEPCRSCAFLDLCRGGCRAVARALVGREDAPDPECPFVAEAATASATSRGASAPAPAWPGS